MPTAPVPPPMPGTEPAPASERLAAIDGIRGFALLGILLMNIEAFNGPLWLSAAGVDPRWEGLDRWLDTAIYVLVQGSFFPLFSLLFGVGCGLMAQRMQARGQAFAPLHLRRMGWLAVIGLLHAVLVWSGDILLSYALLGLLLPALYVLPPRWLGWAGALGIACAAGVALLLAGMLGLMGLAVEDGDSTVQMVAQIKAGVQAQVDLYGQGSWLQACGQRLKDMGTNLQALFVVGGQVLGLFLIGSWLVSSQALANPAAHARLWALLRWLAWPAGVLLSLCTLAISPFNPPWSMEPASMLVQAIKTVAGSLIGLGWLAWGLRLQALLRPLAPAGQMSLTTYLCQSLIGTGVFYGYGLGWFGQLSRSQEVVFVLVVFALQVLLATWWLRHFRQGPVEWLWRMASYGRRLPLRRA